MAQINEESLSMFFDSDFNPSNYVDALFHSLSGDQVQSQIYTKKNLQNLSNKCSNLITHLDYHTNELSADLINQIEVLQNSSNIITQGLNNDEVLSSQNDMTRLQYFINTLKNSVLLLQSDIQQANKDLDSSFDSQPKSIEDLIKLKNVKSNINQVLRIFEKINLITTNNVDSVSIESFNNSINSLYETIKDQLNKEEKEINQILIDNIDELVNLLPLFHNLTNYYPIYKKLINKLSDDKKRYLNAKQ